MGFRSALPLLAGLAVLADALALEVGDPAPAFSGKVVSSGVNTGQVISLEDYRGKVVFLDFWASWCPPCIRSLPAYDQMRRDIGTSEFEVIAVNVDADSEQGLEFLRRHPVSYPVLLDPSGDIGIPYGLRTLPRSFILDRTGRVVASYRSYSEGDEQVLKQAIRQLLQSPQREPQ